MLGESEAENGVLDAVKAVRRAIRALGYDYVELPLNLPIESVYETLSKLRVNIVFNLFEGFAGMPATEAVIAGFVEKLGLPFTGSSSQTLTLALDKAAANQRLRSNGVRTANQQLLTARDLDRFHLGFPCIVKPRADDASHSLSEKSVVFDMDALSREVDAMVNRYDGTAALVEEFLEGREFNATVWGVDSPVVLPLSEIIYTLPEGLPKILTFAAKWEPKSMYFAHTAVQCPANVTPDLRAAIQSTALMAFKAIGCQGYGRVDMRLNKDGHPVVMEVNANPDIAPGTGVARQVKAARLSYKAMVSKIIDFGLVK
ncbi:dalaninedalanine ligase [Dehalogenimonas sp. WBC-2]|nr:dalaninedalanine ligase [Dehalogenimonas sp. WBC-2]